MGLIQERIMNMCIQGWFKANMKTTVTKFVGKFRYLDKHYL